MRWKVRSLASLAVGLVAVGLGAGPAAADTSTSAAGWTALGTAPAGATVQTFTGTFDSTGGCSFNFTASLSRSQTALRGDEIAYNAGTCQTQVAFTGGSSAAAAPAEPSGASVRQAGPVASTLSGAAPTASAFTVNSAGYAKSWYQDPVGIVVNSVLNSTNWHWNGHCVVPPVSGGFQYHWLAVDGWFLISSNWQNFFTCAESTSSSYAQFANDVFCLFHPTETTYNRNTVHGLYNGVLTGNVHASKFGICSPLLSFHFVIKRTLN